jgi:hypothetical protein
MRLSYIALKISVVRFYIYMAFYIYMEIIYQYEHPVALSPYPLADLKLM